MPKNKDLDNFSPLQLVQIFDDRVNGVELPAPESLAYSHKAKRFFAIEKNQIIAIDSQQGRDSKRSNKNIQAGLLDKSLIVQDDKFERLLVLTPKQQLIAIAINSDGSLNPNQQISFALPKSISKVLDITIEPDTGRLFLLQKNTIISILPDSLGSFAKAEVVQIPLPSGIKHAKHIAFDVSTGNLHVLSFPKEQKLYEINQKGELLAIRDASQLGLKQPTDLLFAPTSDTTDASSRQNLFVADATSAPITELSLTAVQTTAAPTTKAYLVRATATKVLSSSPWSNSSPDPSGITYLPSSNTLLMVDGEVDEMPNIFVNSNVFEVKLDGTPVRSGSTTSYTKEPTGISFNPNTGRIFISSDDDRRIYEIALGADGKFGTADDVKVGEVDTSIFKIINNNQSAGTDVEDVVYVNDLSRGIKALFLAGGVDSEIYRVNPGADGKFGTTDDVYSSFDTAIMGLTDVEGIAYNSANGHLYALGNPDNLLFEMTVGGTLVQTIDISAANPLNPAGLVFAPGSKTPSATNLYIVARGVDNDSDPNENDGFLYEFTLTNKPPAVEAGNNQTVAVNTVSLDGTVTDSGAIAFSKWTKLSGPGNVTFGNANAIDTTATFSQPGTYVLRLTAADSELTAQDEVIINYNSSFYVSSVDAGTISSANSSTGVAFDYGDEDILKYDSISKKWSIFFDGSQVGLNQTNQNNENLAVDIDAFHIVRNTDNSINSILFSLDYNSKATSLTLPGGLVVTNTDIVRFTPSSATSWGSNTAGTYSLYFRGANVGLGEKLNPVSNPSDNGENIDAFSILPDGRLLMSFTGSPSLPGVNGRVINGNDEDLFVFTATNTGANTAGTWAPYFDGSDLDLNTNSDEDIDAIWVDNGSNIYLSTRRNYGAIGANTTISGNGNTIFTFIPNSIGLNTSGDLIQFWDGTAAGLNATNSIDGFAVG
ncbi:MULTISPECIES: PKD domain-containing protein [Calothrix]|uniref:PKD domain-containing protein n=2 Tax=Calothrix TaxID=1186 RepID=A0ABR8AKC2_9CYAN|nr:MULTISPECIES: hypothetical protein [Calothrix]MBD2199690.1 hypothetical protein [Calothrix parietina FACHB-288]MBD2228487.1 hypothetical protein [Calothrix anomala FACHB-343]